jgi:hypothetical protein
MDYITFKKESTIIEESQQLLFALELKKNGYKVSVKDKRKEIQELVKTVL